MKKRILSIIIALLFFSTPVWANSIIFHKNRLLKVAGGTFTAANARSSYANTVAFACANGVDWSAYAGTDTGSTLYVIIFQDATGGDTAIGYCGANGTAEAYSGGEIFTDPGFAGTCGVEWTCGTGWSIAGGVAVALNVAYGNAVWRNCAHTQYGLYKGVVNCLSLTGGTWYLYIDASIVNPYFTSIGVKTAYYVASVGGSRGAGVIGRSTLTGEFDDISLQQVTDCAVTGLHIMSAKNGTTQSWYYISPTFGYNDAMTYRIYRVY